MAALREEQRAQAAAWEARRSELEQEVEIARQQLAQTRSELAAVERAECERQEKLEESQNAEVEVRQWFLVCNADHRLTNLVMGRTGFEPGGRAD